MKRFQDCNKIVQIWRYRHYIPIPFLLMYYLIVGFTIVEHETNIPNKTRNSKLIYRLLISLAQTKMNWVYDFDEVMANIEKKLKLKNEK
jgi:hypothetical protein